MSIRVPDHIAHVTGCSCTGGGLWHEAGCGIWSLGPDGAAAAVAEAEQRMRDYATSRIEVRDRGE